MEAIMETHDRLAAADHRSTKPGVGSSNLPGRARHTELPGIDAETTAPPVLARHAGLAELLDGLTPFLLGERSDVSPIGGADDAGDLVAIVMPIKIKDTPKNPAEQSRAATGEP